jgi:hypothetical protein
MAREMMLTGGLRMPDGSPPPDMIPVQAERAGSMLSDLRGEFRFRLRAYSGRIGEAITAQAMANCAVVVRVPGFETIRKNLGGVDIRLGADIGTLVVKPLAQSGGSLISWNSLKAPEEARSELIKAREDANRSKVVRVGARSGGTGQAREGR